MSMQDSHEELNTLFKKICKRNRSSQYVKVDFHIHSPASKDYVKVDKNNDNKTEYELLLRKFAESDVDIFTITDHNASNGFEEIRAILKDNSELEERLRNKLILPGVEITCYNKHYLVIFPENCSKDKRDSFLLECGIGLDEQGDENASADKVSPLMLCEKVENYGGFVLIGHCDAENGLLESYFSKSVDEGIKGKSLIKVLKSKSVLGICYNSNSNLSRLIELKKQFGVEHLPGIQASDSHSSLTEYKGSGLPLGSRSCWIKLGQKSFRAIRLALLNGQSCVINEYPKEKTNPTVVGFCVKGGFLRDKHNAEEWSIIPFSQELNCIIGARGTGKSTLIDILKFVLNPKDKELGKEVLGRFETVICFIMNCSEIFAIRMQPQNLSQLHLTYYQYKRGSFSKLPNSRSLQSKLRNATKNLPITKFIASSTIQSYRQKELFNLAIDKIGPSLVIENLTATKFINDFKIYSGKIDFHRSSIIAHAQGLIADRNRDNKADLTSDYFENQFKAYKEIHLKLLALRKQILINLNEIFQDKLILSYKLQVLPDVYKNIIDRWVFKERLKNNITYEKQRDYKKLLGNLYKNAKQNFGLPFYIFTGNYKALALSSGIHTDLAKDLCDTYYDKVEPDEVIIQPEVITDFKLNVNHGISLKKHFVERSKLSFGQKAVGILLLILHGATELGENRPLLIDQPEDDLDNSYIFHTLVKEFHRIKSTRQLIIATHNANIPIAGDAENILVMESDGDTGWVDFSGSIEHPDISKKVLQILEGDFDAFAKRAQKYGFKLEED